MKLNAKVWLNKDRIIDRQDKSVNVKKANFYLCVERSDDDFDKAMVEIRAKIKEKIGKSRNYGYLVW